MPALSGKQMDIICSNHFHTQDKYRGIFTSNGLPEPNKLMETTPWFIIVNIDPNTSPGSHWVTIYCDNTKSISYFCSVGTRPRGDILKFLESYEDVIINSHQLQTNDGDLCGEFCLFYADLRSLEFTDSEILQLFNPESANQNDDIVGQYVNGHMKS